MAASSSTWRGRVWSTAAPASAFQQHQSAHLEACVQQDAPYLEAAVVDVVGPLDADAQLAGGALQGSMVRCSGEERTQRAAGW
jgi:hypothetical protein